ncbi:hypothetical protein BYT27DRAFT_7216291 [Phlegmacium glaucopus]|nr:hypothetical protein BYT27DRAFT_7216291 [Phlegmacium glaucopus]
MSARELRSANRAAASNSDALPPPSTKSKSTSWKGQQSNADESANKRTKSTTAYQDDNDVEDANDDGIKKKKVQISNDDGINDANDEDDNVAVKRGAPAKKNNTKSNDDGVNDANDKAGAKANTQVNKRGKKSNYQDNDGVSTRGKAPVKKRGKKSMKTGAQRIAQDAVENAKGTPAHLTPVEHALEAATTSVAPPERPPRSPTASFLPPPPTLVGARLRIAREPEIMARKTNIGNSDGSSTDTDTEDDTEDDSSSEKSMHPSQIRIGPPTRKARQHSKPSKASLAHDDGNYSYSLWSSN